MIGETILCVNTIAFRYYTIIRTLLSNVFMWGKTKDVNSECMSIMLL